MGCQYNPIPIESPENTDREETADREETLSSPLMHCSAGRHLNSCSSLNFSAYFMAFTFEVEILKVILLNSGEKAGQLIQGKKA